MYRESAIQRHAISNGVIKLERKLCNGGSGRSFAYLLTLPDYEELYVVFSFSFLAVSCWDPKWVVLLWNLFVLKSSRAATDES